MHTVVMAMVLGGSVLVGFPDSRSAAGVPGELEWRQRATEGMQRAVNYLLEHQEPDGAFGHWRGPIGSDDWGWPIPGQHYAWQVATTAITCVTLKEKRKSQEPEETDASDPPCPSTTCWGQFPASWERGKKG